MIQMSVFDSAWIFLKDSARVGDAAGTPAFTYPKPQNWPPATTDNPEEKRDNVFRDGGGQSQKLIQCANCGQNKTPHEFPKGRMIGRAMGQTGPNICNDCSAVAADTTLNLPPDQLSNNPLQPESQTLIKDNDWAFEGG